MHRWLDGRRPYGQELEEEKQMGWGEVNGWRGTPNHCLMSVSQPGVCRYGSKLECCYGWRKNKGHCEAACERGCKYGECVGPNKCKCFPGFTGKTCSQGLYTFYSTVQRATLSLHLLPPFAFCLILPISIFLALDIDECSAGKAICSYNRRCVNTFGSYYCKCQIGYELKYISGHYVCVDINECAASTHQCNIHAECLNTQGSFKCKCKQGYRGSGFECSVIPEKLVKEVSRIPGAIKDTIKKLLAHKSSVKKHEEIKNVIPEPAMTPASKVHLTSFDYEDGVYIGGTYDEEEKETEDAVEEEEQEEEQEDLENQIGHEQSLRGDVFSKFPKVKEAAAFGPVLAQRKVPVSKPEQEGDGYYMAVPAFVGHKKNVGRLKLLLTDLKPKWSYCLIFSYRLAGDRVGKLRVFLGSHRSTPAWEQSRGKDERWRTGKIEMLQGAETTKNIIFESERGKGKTGEIGVDTVTLVSGLCPKDHLIMDI
uniref:EGF like domain multiple 6 n=1 Tax=Chelydra serpentina TaxID=8475 RepID=A0A8C3S908_CHESE